MALTAMMHESVWFEKPQFEENEAHYQLHLAGSNRPTVSAFHQLAHYANFHRD